MKRHGRALGTMVLHVPQTLRALVRADEVWLVILAAGVGIASGLFVIAMNLTAVTMHAVFFDLPWGTHLSSAAYVPPLRSILVPTLGGLAVGLSLWVLARYRPRKTVDPIEANALHGGRMSLNDSLIVVGQTILSNGVGGSIGLEAGYAQIGAAVGSRLGRAFRVRRSDLRVLVGCGAAGAIAAAFNAPLTGAFYGFELIIGTYSLAILAPVMASTICAVLVMRLLRGNDTLDLHVPASIPPEQYVPILALGVLAAFVGILIMRVATKVEELFRNSGVPIWLRPVIGGLIVGTMSLYSPQVLSSGHGALREGLMTQGPLLFIASILVMKSFASAVSIATGFRGGLFFASLFLGELLGKTYGDVLALLAPAASVPLVICAVVGMSALAVAVVGGPLTMSFLALETTGSLPLTIAVLMASTISSLTVRRTFGYSFATWRFHLRGESIRSAVDVGWVRNLSVGRMMRREIHPVRADMRLTEFRNEIPLGARSRVVVVDEADRYVGIIQVPEAHAANGTATRVGEIVHHAEDFLLPRMTVKEATALFERSESDALAVVQDAESRKVIGLLTEQHALRRYSEELDRRRRELSGE